MTITIADAFRITGLINERVEIDNMIAAARWGNFSVSIGGSKPVPLPADGESEYAIVTYLNFRRDYIEKQLAALGVAVDEKGS